MRKPICYVWVSILVAFIAEGAYAQANLIDMPSTKWWTNKRFIQQLKLTLDQQTKIEAVWMQSRRILIDQKAEFERRQLDLTELLKSDSIEDAAAIKAYDKFQEARISLERSTFLMRLQIRNLLSADQQQRLERIAVLLREQRGKANATPALAEPKVPVKK